MDATHTNNAACSFSSVVNGGGSSSSSRSKNTSSKVDFGMLKKRGDREEGLQGVQYQEEEEEAEEEEEEEEEDEDGVAVGGRNEETHHGRGVVAAGGLVGWPNSSSRIIRVSRATGGKDRHSKVLTSRGLRDRRIRLSVTTAIQFYDLQDRLGYDQPSKAVEWLINAAADPIAELPSLNSCFSTLTQQQQQLMTRSHNNNNHHHPHNSSSSSSRNKRRQSGGQLFDSFDDVGFDPLPLSKSACSSTSETSKGSGLSLARADVAVARVSRVVKSKERATEESPPISHKAASFSELLAAAGDPAATSSAAVSAHDQQARIWPATAMDYFNTSTTFSGQTHPGNILQHSAAAAMASFNVIGGGGTNHGQHQHAGLQQLSLVQDHIIPGSVSSSSSSQPQPAGSDYNLNFTISSAAGVPAAFNRGTLQSNFPSSMWPPHVQRFAPPDGSINNLPIFIGAATPVDNNHQRHHPFPSVFDSRLQLCYGDGNSRHSEQKGKGEH